MLKQARELHFPGHFQGALIPHPSPSVKANRAPNQIGQGTPKTTIIPTLDFRVFVDRFSDNSHLCSMHQHRSAHHSAATTTLIYRRTIFSNGQPTDSR